jgi:subtilase family serine protease
MRIRRGLPAIAASAACLSALIWALLAGSATAAKYTPHTGSAAFALKAPATAYTGRSTGLTACTLPNHTFVQGLHCYTPEQIRAAYGVKKVAPLTTGVPNYGQGQTIVLVDSYGSPTAAADLKHFHNTFFPNLPEPKFQQVFPNGNPQYHNTCKNSQGQSGPCSAAGWSGEATLDIEWAYAIAPKAHLILLAVPPAETEGVQGFPNLFKAMSKEIAATPPGTVFSMSFGITEQTFGGAAKTQTARFDKVFKQGLAKKDNFFAASGDNGSTGPSKQHKETKLYPFPVSGGWPATSPYVVSVGGTQLQYGWTWDPTSNDPFKANGSLNPGYWKSTSGGDTQPVWNESWADIASGGGTSVIYPRPSWQSGVDPGYGNHRIIPDTAWNAAVNGGVDVYITAYPSYNCAPIPPFSTQDCWQVYGGTSAASPQTAALVALANAARKHAGKQPIGFLDPILYQDGVGANAYKDVVRMHEGSAPKTFAGSDITPSGTVRVNKSVGDLRDNQLWEVPIAGWATTRGYDATTGWGTPKAAKFVAALKAMP